MTLIAPQTIIKADKQNISLIPTGQINIYSPDAPLKIKESFPGFMQPKTSKLEIKDKLCKLILTKICSSENPFKYGEETYYLNMNSPFSIVTKSFCLKIEIPAAAFFKIMQ